MGSSERDALEQRNELRNFIIAEGRKRGATSGFDGLVQSLKQISAARSDATPDEATIIARALALDKSFRFEPVHHARDARRAIDHPFCDHERRQSLRFTAQNVKNVVLLAGNVVRLQHFRDGHAHAVHRTTKADNDRVTVG